MADELTLDESMESCLAFFRSAVTSASKPPAEIYEGFGGHSAVAWDLRDDLLAGKPLLGCAGLTASLRVQIAAIVELAQRVPEAAVACAGMRDLLHPDWQLVREAAIEFPGGDMLQEQTGS